MAETKKGSQPSSGSRQQAATKNREGLQYYGDWEMEQAIAAFQAAIKADPTNPEYHLNLARAHARAGHFDEAMKALGNYLHRETDQKVASRYERLFFTALDQVEELLIKTMQQMEMPLQQVAKAIQMWLEYRIAVGRRPLQVPKPALWAAALTFAVDRINMGELARAEVAATYGVPERSLQDKYRELVTTLDLMPADFRYFVGEVNPLDKVVEAAQLLEEMYGRFEE